MVMSKDERKPGQYTEGKQRSPDSDPARTWVDFHLFVNCTQS